MFTSWNIHLFVFVSAGVEMALVIQAGDCGQLDNNKIKLPKTQYELKTNYELNSDTTCILEDSGIGLCKLWKINCPGLTQLSVCDPRF